MKITILGTGAYGLALALMINKNINDVMMWTPFEDERENLVKTRSNDRVLPGIKIPHNIKVETDLARAVKNTDLIIIAVPTEFVDGVAEQLSDILTGNEHICIASKGIQRESCLFLNEVVLKYIKTDKLSVISGPSFAIDIANMDPVGLTIATTNIETEKIVKRALEGETLKLRSTEDIIGAEICGAIKNVIAIASGMLSGMELPESTQAMFVTESLHDIRQLIDALGGKKNTILSFAGFGDLLLTATSKKSRNFKLGYLIGSNASKEEIDNYINNTTIEGLYTLKSIHKLINNKKIDMPIIDLIETIIYKNEDPKRLVSFLIEKD